MLTTDITQGIGVAQGIVEEELHRQNPSLPLPLSLHTTFAQCNLQDGPQFLCNITGKLKDAHGLSDEQRQQLWANTSRAMSQSIYVDHLVREIAGEIHMITITG
ncbi:MAG: hypothetical protein AAB853_01700 [Patescibacteria group bacterium]